MLLEKHSRFFRRYEFKFSSHARSVTPPNLVNKDEKLPSLLKGLRKAMLNGKAELNIGNGDKIELIKAVHYPESGVIALLIHRGSPNAADPSYRKRVKDKITIRPGKKELLEEQALSAHLIIKTVPNKPHLYGAILEEIPGISFSRVKELIALSLRHYDYQYIDKKKNEQSTYACLKAFGIKSEALNDALKKKGSLNFVTLTRTQIAGVPDSEGVAEAREIQVKYKIVGDPTDPEWQKKFQVFVGAARKANWDDVRLDLNLDDNRHKTVKIDRMDEAAEILFVRSEQVDIETSLEPCTVEIIPEIVEKSVILVNR